MELVIIFFSSLLFDALRNYAYNSWELFNHAHLQLAFHKWYVTWLFSLT